MVNYEVTGMSVKDLYRRVKNGQISLESKYLTKATTSNEKLLLRGVLSAFRFRLLCYCKRARAIGCFSVGKCWERL